MKKANKNGEQADPDESQDQKKITEKRRNSCQDPDKGEKVNRRDLHTGECQWILQGSGEFDILGDRQSKDP